MIKRLWDLLKLAIFFFISNLIAAFLLGLFSGIASVAGGNIIFTGVHSISFNPQITIAYLLVFYFLLMFHRPQSNSQYGLFVLTLFLSFMMNFVQGSILLVIFFFFASKLRLI